MRWNADRRRLDTGRSLDADALCLGALLAAGLTVVVPVLSLVTPVPTLVWVALVGVGYGAVAVAVGRATVGVYASLLVTATFAANVPLASGAYLRSMTRDLGPNVWLAHLPLALLLVLLAHEDRERFVDLSRAEWLLGGFVGWVVVAAVVSHPVRVDTALYFALFVLWGGLVFAAVRRAHHVLRVSPTTTLSVLATTVAFKAGFGVAEAVHGASFGLTQLGELSPELAVRLATLPLGPVSVSVGTYVSGFAGMSFLLGSLVVLTLPFALALTLDPETRTRRVGAFAALLLAVALRLTGTDAGRGAALLALACFAAWVAARRRATPTAWRRERLLRLALVAAACVVVLLLPSTQSGVPNVTGPAPVATGVSIPLFDLSNLGVRLRQYAAGLALFLTHPLFGIGGANFPDVAATYGIPDHLPIHNVYVALLAETGVVGFVLYVGFLLAVLRGGVRNAMAPTASPRRAAAFTGVVGYLGFMFWDYMLFDSVASSFAFYAVCAVLVADAER
ncbi:MAG: O-antigen ligase family protein [Haloplanus sp.]